VNIEMTDTFLRSIKRHDQSKIELAIDKIRRGLGRHMNSRLKDYQEIDVDKGSRIIFQGNPEEGYTLIDFWPSGTHPNEH
jgi:hypothetical protein